MEKQKAKEFILQQKEEWQSYPWTIRNDIKSYKISFDADMLGFLEKNGLLQSFEHAVFMCYARCACPLADDTYAYLSRRYPDYYPEIFWRTGNTEILARFKDYQALVKVQAWTLLAEEKQWNLLAANGQSFLLAQCQQWEVLAAYDYDSVLFEYGQYQLLANKGQWDMLAKAGIWWAILLYAPRDVWESYKNSAFAAGFHYDGC